jgi:hypothetical protein
LWCALRRLGQGLGRVELPDLAVRYGEAERSLLTAVDASEIATDQFVCRIDGSVPQVAHMLEKGSKRVQNLLDE